MSELTKLYPDIVAEGVEKIRGSLFFGIPVDAFDRDELLAFAWFGWKDNQRLREAVKGDE